MTNDKINKDGLKYITRFVQDYLNSEEYSNFDYVTIGVGKSAATISFEKEIGPEVFLVCKSNINMPNRHWMLTFEGVKKKEISICCPIKPKYTDIVRIPISAYLDLKDDDIVLATFVDRWSIPEFVDRFIIDVSNNWILMRISRELLDQCTDDSYDLSIRLLVAHQYESKGTEAKSHGIDYIKPPEDLQKMKGIKLVKNTITGIPSSGKMIISVSGIEGTNIEVCGINNIIYQALAQAKYNYPNMDINIQGYRTHVVKYDSDIDRFIFKDHNGDFYDFYGNII